MVKTVNRSKAIMGNHQHLGKVSLGKKRRDQALSLSLPSQLSEIAGEEFGTVLLPSVRDREVSAPQKSPVRIL